MFSHYILQRHLQYYMDEVELNSRFRTFAVNSSLLYGGYNTVCAQLKHMAKQTANEREFPIPLSISI